MQEGGDSMVNIVEFEQDQNNSPKSRGRLIENNSILLSTPFKNDEGTDSKSHFLKKKASQTMVESNSSQRMGNLGNLNHRIVKASKEQDKSPSGKVRNKSDNKKARVDRGSAQKPSQEAEFIQVLSGCDSSGESTSTGKLRRI